MNALLWRNLQHLGHRLRITTPRVRGGAKQGDAQCSAQGTNPAITFLCPAINVPLGGIKVIYKNSEYLSGLRIESYVFHPEISGFSCDWFSHSANIRSRAQFDSERDFIVVPEVWACEFGKQCKSSNLNYAIFVQNGYLIDAALQGTYSAAKFMLHELESCYESAQFVMSISEDTTRMLTLAYPWLASQKIIRMLPHLGDSFSIGRKRKLITYMPRKLEDHCRRYYSTSRATWAASGKFARSLEKANPKQRGCFQSRRSLCHFAIKKALAYLHWRRHCQAISLLGIPGRELKNILIAQSFEPSSMGTSKHSSRK